jgi:hypothetical protein
MAILKTRDGTRRWLLPKLELKAERDKKGHNRMESPASKQDELKLQILTI